MVRGSAEGEGGCRGRAAGPQLQAAAGRPGRQDPGSATVADGGEEPTAVFQPPRPTASLRAGCRRAVQQGHCLRHGGHGYRDTAGERPCRHGWRRRGGHVRTQRGLPCPQLEEHRTRGEPGAGGRRRGHDQFSGGCQPGRDGNGCRHRRCNGLGVSEASPRGRQHERLRAREGRRCRAVPT